MRNFALPTGPVRLSTEMHRDSLANGQVLVRADYPSWGSGQVRLSRYVVVRTTKTRVIIRPEGGEREVRLIVKNDRVTCGAEGGSRYSSFDHYNLMSLQDDELERIHNRNEGQAVADAARAAAVTVGKELTVENAQAAIQALSLYLVRTNLPD